MSTRSRIPTAEPERAGPHAHTGARTGSQAARKLRALPAATLRRLPTAAWICALVAFLSAACWSIVTPPFQSPDEPDHFAYVKQLAETGELPSSSSERVSGEELGTLLGLHAFRVRLRPQVHTIASRHEQSALEYQLALAAGGRPGSPAAGVAASQPPLYYAFESIPYLIAAHGNELDRLQLMRLLSALFAALTAAFVFLFVREALPAARWSWTVAGLAIAFAPPLGFASGSVNPDSLLFAISAAVFYMLARSFRSGLTMRAGATLGALTALGILTKVNFLGLLPGVLLGMAVLAVRAARSSGRSAYRGLALGVAIALSPIALYVAVHALSGQPTLGIVSNAIRTTHGSLLSEASYIWQLYLPRLPGMTNDFPGIFTTRQLWFNGYVGLYGWLDTPFPAWVESLALIPAAAIAVLCGRSLIRGRALLAARAGELAVYAAMGLGLMLLIGADSYRTFPTIDGEYAQVRYLLPLLPLLGAILALAARGAGRRWGPAVGALIVVLFIGHDIFGQLQEVARFYG